MNAAGDPESLGFAAMLLGGISKNRRDLPTALKWYQRAFRVDDLHRPLATGHLGELHYVLGDHDGARTWYERMLAATDEPDLVAEGAFRLGVIAAEDGERERAIGFLERAVATGQADFAEQAAELLARLVAGAQA